MRHRVITLGAVFFYASCVFAQQAPAPDMNQQVQKLLAGKNSQAALGQAIVVGSLLGCTQKKAGQPATQAFYSRMQAIGKTVGEACKQGRKADARQQVLRTLAENQQDPAVTALLGCYETQGQSLAPMAGPKLATDLAHYSRWLGNPQLAAAEMKESDVCR